GRRRRGGRERGRELRPSRRAPIPSLAPVLRLTGQAACLRPAAMRTLPAEEVAMRKALTIAAVAAGTALLARGLRRGASLRGRVVLITGGSRGLGLVLARKLVRSGARIAICARDERELGRARDHLAALGGEVLAVVRDHRLQQP